MNTLDIYFNNPIKQIDELIKQARALKHRCPTCHGMDDESCDCETCNGFGYVNDDEMGKDQEN